jgi:hypothetical protein
MPNDPNGAGRLDRIEALLDKMADRLDKVVTIARISDLVSAVGRLIAK